MLFDLLRLAQSLGHNNMDLYASLHAHQHQQGQQLVAEGLKLDRKAQLAACNDAQANHEDSLHRLKNNLKIKASSGNRKSASVTSNRGVNTSNANSISNNNNNNNNNIQDLQRQQCKPLDLSVRKTNLRKALLSPPINSSLRAAAGRVKDHTDLMLQHQHQQQQQQQRQQQTITPHSLPISLICKCDTNTHLNGTSQKLISSSTSPFSSASSHSGSSSELDARSCPETVLSSSNEDCHLNQVGDLESGSEKLKQTRHHLCLHCGRSFSRSDMLTRHSRLHSGLKPYQCDKCKQVFSRSDHLATHERTHTGEKPYQCQLCAYSACRRDMITRHMRIHEQSCDRRKILKLKRNLKYERNNDVDHDISYQIDNREGDNSLEADQQFG